MVALTNYERKDEDAYVVTCLDCLQRRRPKRETYSVDWVTHSRMDRQTKLPFSNRGRKREAERRARPRRGRARPRRGHARPRRAPSRRAPPRRSAPACSVLARASSAPARSAPARASSAPASSAPARASLAPARSVPARASSALATVVPELRPCSGRPRARGGGTRRRRRKGTREDANLRPVFRRRQNGCRVWVVRWRMIFLRKSTVRYLKCGWVTVWVVRWRQSQLG